MVFYFYTIIYSEVVLNQISFFLLLNVNAILRNKENQTVAGPQWLPYFPYIKVNVDQQIFGYPD